MKIVVLLAVAASVLVGCKPAVVPSTPAPALTDVGQPAPATAPLPPGGAAVPEVLASPQPAVPPARPAPKPAVRSSYQPFTVAAYQQARVAGQPVLLYFYATWCPLCASQEPIVVNLLSDPQIADWGVAAFRVNYNDRDTDGDEQELARQLGVNYQHTFFTFDRSGKQVWRATGTQRREQLKSRLSEIR